MIPELLPEAFQGDDPHVSKRAYVDCADVILCVSESTRADLLKVLAPDPDRVHVTPLGVGPDFMPNLPSLPDWPADYILYVGARGGYKDFATLAAAFADALSDFRDDMVLVAVGGGAWTAGEEQLLARLRLDGRVRLAQLNDAELARAYANATAFVMPSLYEGFGLPALEAMASGCPAILAKAASLPEVGGRAASYFDPGDVDALRSLLVSVVGDEERRGQMIEAGTLRASKYTWSETARLTAAAYHSVFQPGIDD